MQLLQKNYFELFALAPRFRINSIDLEHAFRELQHAVHPDRFAADTAQQRRLAMQAATLANEAWRCLRDPVQRAAYLCRMHGFAVDDTSRSALSGDFLNVQMQWRETLEELRGRLDEAVLATLRSDVLSRREALLADLERLIDREHAFEPAARSVRELMFVDRFLSQLDDFSDESR